MLPDVKLFCHIRGDLHQLIRQEAYENNVTQRKIIEDSLKLYFNIHEKEEEE